MEATPLSAPAYPLTPRLPAAVALYSSTLPDRPHQDVAIIQAEQNDDRGLGVMIAKIREKAGEMGCDAILISGASERAGAPPGSSAYLFEPGSHLLYATCIVWLAGATSKAALSAPAQR